MLLDDDIVDVLKKTGVDIARRTVAKYRGAMNIHPLSKAAARSVHCRGPPDSEGCRQPASTLEQAGPVLLERDCDISRPVFWAALFCSPAAGRHSRSQQLSICGRNSVVPDREEGPKRSRYPEQPVQRHRLSSGHSACRRPVTRASTHGGNSLSDF
ncbi:hypothetical protein SMa0824 (plasmid) [Sinorhizobium meliloti 1021]|uniref:RNA polymerase sigma factor 54 DNA-binding domain-containing protein n=1 Tax=Rhizobium meliloti (strain 1021) TaxID=266834 RepID=Q92ZL5_RHIME|nr:hypothetical protein SMa0824 [Sinorhizobium meliloti 1021]AGG70133.1 Hypothetical protein SM2011_a0824 [Sinorhizobium meliloti 2011]